MKEMIQEVVEAKVIKIDPYNGLDLILLDGRRGHVDIFQIGDFDHYHWSKHFEIDKQYTFKIMGKYRDSNMLRMSYKLCHPEYIKNKFKIIATMSHHFNLRKKVLKELEQSSTKRSLNQSKKENI